jgi:lysyl-tRNA synthetase class 2
LEVETPLRIPAPAPEVHIEAVASEGWFLHTSPELCMKRLVAAGFERIFQICHCFRRGERGRRHLPEFALLEWYTAGHTYLDMMDQTRELICHAAWALGSPDGLRYQGRPIPLEAPWPRISVAEAFGRYGSLSMELALAQNRFDEIMGLEIEPNLGLDKPVFLYDYPGACGALARAKPDDPTLVERFELYIAGLEICNAFGELTDAAEQRRRFEADNRQRRRAGKTAYPPAEPFLADLARMPAAAGNALGLDRLVMLFADAAAIDAVVAFTPEAL